MAGSISLEKPGFWRARIGAAEQLNAPGLHPASCVSIQPVFKSGLSTCCHTETIAEPLLMRFQPLRRAKCGSTGNAAVGAFAFQRRCFVVAGSAVLMHMSPFVRGRRMGDSAEVPRVVAGISSGRHHKTPSPSGRALTQQMGECRRRTHQSDAAHDPSGAALCRDRSEQASKPTLAIGPRYGCLEVRMHRFMRAVGPPCYFSGGRWLKLPACRESRGQLFPLICRAYLTALCRHTATLCGMRNERTSDE